MTTRKVVALTADALAALPPSCRSCLFWELGHARPDPRQLARAAAARSDDVNAARHGDELAGDAVVQKQAWCAARAHDGTPPGRAVLVDDEPTGYALFAAADAFAPRRPRVPPVSDDALLLATIWIAPHGREQGLARLLVQAALKEALRLGLAAVEAYGDRRFREHDCVLPTTWLLHEGFGVHREHPRYPLLRVDTRRTVRWSNSLEHALEEVRGRLPQRAPAPVPGRSSR